MMPLAFQSLNRGVIPFGFFNIDTDLLLLDHYFLFADEFCTYIGHLAGQKGESSYETSWEVADIPNQMDIGDLMGAIHGIRHTGFIGEVYQQFPFPQREADFKQKPEGFQTRSTIEPILGRYARRVLIPFRAGREQETVAIGEFLFTKKVFHQLLEYVWVGGYPQWKDGIRPAYVLEMKKEIEGSQFWLFTSQSS